MESSSLASSSSTSSSSSRKGYVLTLCTAAAAGAVGCLWLKHQMNRQGPPAPTDFDAFLRAPVPAAPKKPSTAAGGSAKSWRKKPAKTAVTDFESFLKVQPVAAAEEAPAATDFLAFLKDGGNSSSSNTAAAAEEAAAAAEAVPEEALPVLVLYGTEYGFAREIAEKLAEQLKGSGRFWPLLENAAHHPSGMDLAAQQAALLVFSTQGDGVPPTEARDFCDWLTAGKAGPLPGLAYSVCALGDTSYTHFCRCGKSLDAALGAAGAELLTGRVDVDKEDWAKVDAWIADCIAQLTAAADASKLRSFAQLGGVAAVTGGSSGSSSTPAGYSKSRPYYARVVLVEGLCTLRNPDDKDTVKVELELGPEALAAGGLAYLPGDALGIWPSNPPQAVEELLQHLGLSGDEPVPRPTWHYQEQQQQQQQTPADNSSSSMSLRHALAVCYDIKTPKAPQLLQLLLEQLTAAAEACDDSSKLLDQQQQQQQQQSPLRPSIDLQVDATGGKFSPGAAAAAAAAADGGSKPSSKAAAAAAASPAAAIAAVQALLAADAAVLEQYLAARHVIDLLQEAAPAKLTPQQLLSVLRPLQPRLYSISSTPLEYDPPGSGVAATIAVVRYTSLDKERQGVCSTQVAERLAPGTLLPVFVSKNPDFRLPPSPSTPLVMVGPGTGLAPFRSFILHRLLLASQQQQQGGEQEGETAATAAAAGPLGAMHLFFGCRRRDQDFLYGQQLTDWAADRSITLHTAFSREGPQKVYVQQRLREAAGEVWALLAAGGHFYVCGDAGSMAGAVEEALLEIFEQQGGCEGREGARAHLQALADAGRYERDVWFS